MSWVVGWLVCGSRQKGICVGKKHELWPHALYILKYQHYNMMYWYPIITVSIAIYSYVDILLQGPLGWDMISMNVAFKCCLLKLPQDPRNHKTPLTAAFG